ncbi:unnamed protein product [Urochloa humidicola]
MANVSSTRTQTRTTLRLVRTWKGGGQGCWVRRGYFGEAFAYLEIKATWSHLLRNFELKLVSPFPENNWNSLLAIGIKGKVMVNYNRRKIVVGS